MSVLHKKSIICYEKMPHIKSLYEIEDMNNIFAVCR